MFLVEAADNSKGRDSSRSGTNASDDSIEKKRKHEEKAIGYGGEEWSSDFSRLITYCTGFPYIVVNVPSNF